MIDKDAASIERENAEFDELVKDVPKFKVFRRNPQTREERDRKDAIFGVKTPGDIVRAIMERLQSNANEVSSSVAPRRKS